MMMMIWNESEKKGKVMSTMNATENEMAKTNAALNMYSQKCTIQLSTHTHTVKC